MLAKTILCSAVSLAVITTGNAQSTDSNRTENKPAKKYIEQRYSFGDKTYVYYKPKSWSFLSNLPKDAKGLVAAPFKSYAIKPLLLVAGATALFLSIDEPASDAVHQFSANIHFHAEEEYKNVWSIKTGKTSISLIKVPQNLNTAFYQMGEGFPSLLIGGGLLVYGKIHNNYRAISTANQLVETFILMGAGTQILKRITGRQSPSEVPAEQDGSWHLFPAFSQYQQHTPNFDAFPSGHLATLMSTLTVLLQNYPEKKWIAPVGYSVMGLVGYSMINNNVHWLSDYPLAIALGYLCGKQVVSHNRKVEYNHTPGKNKPSFSYTVNYMNGKMMPGVICRF